MNTFRHAWAVIGIATLTLFGCGEKQMGEPIPDTWAKPAQDCPLGTDKSVLAGLWRYLEQGSSFVLNLDEQASGNYSWKEGRFISHCLDRQTLRGYWQQSENDREGGYEVRLNRELTAGEGRWWYSRIGDQTKPKQAGGTFKLERASGNAQHGLTPVEKSSSLSDDTRVER